MGEISDMMLDGTLCALCGVAMLPQDWPEDEDWEPPGFPVYCEGCEE